MLKQIIAFLLRKSIVQSITEQSSKATAIFNETVKKLQDANNEALERVAANDKKVQSITSQSAELTTIVTKNNGLINKIESLFS